MIKNSKSLMIGFGIIFSLIAISQGQADIDQMIQAGIDYIEENQDPASGFWGTDKETPYRDGAVVVDVLARLEDNYTVDTEILEDGFYAVHFWRTSSSDYLARKIITSASFQDGVVNPYLVDSLVSMQNIDGGWGYQKLYGSNTLETSLAIKALVAASYEDPDPSVLTPAANFLVTTQHSGGGGDYGWGFVDEGDSRVLFTAHAVTALSALQDNYTGYDFSTQIGNAFTWLRNVQHGDEGFGSNENFSNAYETGLAICAMIAHDPSALEVKDAWGYLENTQMPDGSWDSDSYSTAMAISGLNCIDPDNFLYEYLAGDANMYGGGWPPAVNGLDVMYLVNYFKGSGNPCLMVGSSYNLWASADANASCNVNGLDITYLTAYLKGGPAPLYCPDFEPAWPPLPDTAPPGWPNCYTPSLTNEVTPAGEGK